MRRKSPFQYYRQKANNLDSLLHPTSLATKMRVGGEWRWRENEKMLEREK